MSTHCHRCIIHPQHNKVGVCGLCVRDRLLALVEEYSSSSVEAKRCTSPASGTASDGPYHSFSSSSAREHHFQLSPPGAPPAEPLSGPPATASLLQKLKLKAFISIPPSPDHAFAKNASGFHSPSPAVFHQKNKLSLPFKSRKSSVSELAEGLYMHSKVAPETSDDQISAPSTMSTVRQRKPSLMSLLNQSEVALDTTYHNACEASENAIHAPSEERLRRIEQFSAAMRSPGYAFPSAKAATLHDYRQAYTAEYLADHGAVRAPVRGSTEQASNSYSSSWIASLFQRRKRKATSKSKSKAVASEATLVNEVLAEASARNSMDYARISVDTGGMTPSLKQMIRSRVQQVEAEVATNIPKNEVGAKTRYTQGWPPVDGEHFNAKVEPVTGFTAKVGIDNKHHRDDQEAHVLEEARHFPRSRSWGRAWSRTHSSRIFMASPQHQLLGSSKQHLNNNNNVKLSSVHQHQHHYLTSTPKHPAMDAAAPKDSRVATGFYFNPFRKSKRQGCAAPLLSTKQG